MVQDLSLIRNFAIIAHIMENQLLPTELLNIAVA